MKQSDLLKLSNWCQLLSIVCPGMMTVQCISVWPTARQATSLWSSKWLWMSSVSRIHFCLTKDLKEQIIDRKNHLVYFSLVTFLHTHTFSLFLCLHLLFSECLRMSENVGLKT